MIRLTRRDRSTRLRRLWIDALESRALMSFGGSPDVSFGTAGHVQVFFGAGQTTIADEATQPDGKIVVVGQLSVPSLTEGISFPTNSVSVARLNPDGSLDATFGTGGVENLFSNPDNQETKAQSVAIQPDGKIVIGAVVKNVSEVVRLDANGTIDMSFGTQGVATLPTIGSSGIQIELVGMAIAPDGSIVVSGLDTSKPIDYYAFDLVKFTAAGSIDSTFGTAGVATTNFITTLLIDTQTSSSGLLVQPDGKIDFAGTILPRVLQGDSLVSAGLAVLQLNPDGSPDSTFGTAGYGQFSNSFAGQTDVQEVASGLALQADGKLVVGGYAGVSPYGYNQFFAARLDADGTPDSTFGGGGTGIAPVGLQSPDVGTDPSATTVTIAPDGKILIGGVAFQSVAVARLTATGEPDTTFGQGGEAIVGVPGDTLGNPVGLFVRADGVIMATTSEGYLLALRSTGAADDYNDDGVSDPAVYLPNQAVFAYRPSGGAPDVVVPFGFAGAGQTIPAPGYYDISGRSELGVYLPALGEFAYRPADGGNDVVIPFGIPGDGQTIPAVGYYDGTGRQDIAAYLPSVGIYAIRPTSGPDELVSFGIAGAGQSIPVPGDYEGTGVDDIAVYLPALGSYAIRPSSGGPDKIIPFGIAGAGQSIPMPGDYDGSGKTELGVYLPALGDFIYRPANGGPDVIVSFGLAGTGQTLPAVGDYDGSGHDELGVYLPSLGLFAYRPGLPAAPTGADVVLPFGIAGAGQTIPFTADPASNALPTAVSAASVSAESASWIDIAPMATKAKKAASVQASTDLPSLG